MKTQTDINIIETQRSTTPTKAPTMDTQTLTEVGISRHLQLDQWIEQMDAITLFSKTVQDVSLEGYRVAGETVIVMRYARGYHIFTSSPTTVVPIMLRDAERRLGVAKIPDPKEDVDFVAGLVRFKDMFMEPAQAEILGLALLAASDKALDPRNHGVH